VRHSEGGLLQGDVVNSSDLDYAMQGVSWRRTVVVYAFY